MEISWSQKSVGGISLENVHSSRPIRLHTQSFQCTQYAHFNTRRKSIFTAQEVGLDCRFYVQGPIAQNKIFC
jgi:hypothetical protein